MSALVKTVLDLTDRVESAIEAGDWVEAQQLDAERRRLLEQLAFAADAGEAKTTFAVLEERNFRLIGLVQHLQRRVLREAAVARTASDGAAAYAALGEGAHGAA